MVSLKQLHENFINEEINNNYFLRNLFEAIDANKINKIADSIDKLEDVANKLKNGAIERAMLEARTAANKVITASGEEQDEILTNLIGFYSKITNFFKTDLPALQRVTLKDFFSDKTPDVAKLTDQDNDKQIRAILRKALTTDSFFGKILGRFKLTSQLASAVPYLNIEDFIQTFMTTPKSELKANIAAVVGAAGGLNADPSGAGAGTGTAGGGSGGGGGAGGAGGGEGTGTAGTGGTAGGAPAGGGEDKTAPAIKAYSDLVGAVASAAGIAADKLIKTDGFAGQVFERNAKFDALVKWAKDYASERAPS